MNAHYKKIRAIIALLTDGTLTDEQIFNAMADNRTPVSKSALQSWRVSETHKNFRHMSSEQLFDVISAIYYHFEHSTNDPSNH